MASFLGHIGQTVQRAIPYGKQTDPLTASITKSLLRQPPAPPGPPNVNDAANAAREQTDALRARRGLLANIYAGSSSAQPVTGKTQLGT